MITTIDTIKKIHFVTYLLISNFMKFNFDLNFKNQIIIDNKINKCYDLGIPLTLIDFEFKDFIFDIRIDELDKWMNIHTFIYSKKTNNLLLVIPILKWKGKITNTINFNTSYNK